MTQTTTDEKKMAVILNETEEEDDISISVDGTHYRGMVTGVVEDVDDEIQRRVTLDDGDLVHQINVRYTGPDDVGHRMSNSEDFEIFVTGVGKEYDVDAVATWGDSDIPNDTLDEVDDEYNEAIVEDFEEELEEVERAMTELQAFRNNIEAALRGEITLAQMEEEMRMVEMESGGRLVLDSR